MSWNIKPTAFTMVITEDVVNRQKAISKDMLIALADKHPVDTSRFVSNLHVSLDTPSNVYNENNFRGRGATIAKGMAVINSLNKRAFRNLYFTNTTPYGKYLEGGWSRQAINGVFLPAFLGVSMWYQ